MATVVVTAPSLPGKRVIGFMSGNQQHPGLMCEIFILAPTDVIVKIRRWPP